MNEDGATAGSTAPAMTVHGLTVESDQGVYETRRAAALSGVPESTINYWARTDLLTPSIAPGPRDRLWSWNDLLSLRLVDWLRRPKEPRGPRKTPTQEIRRALEQVRAMGYRQGEIHWLLTVAADGRVYVEAASSTFSVAHPGQTAMAPVLDLVRPYHEAPDLLEPRPLLRIIPGKLHGEPHILRTRIPSAAVYALYVDGYAVDDIAEMYPGASLEGFQQAIDFERDLEVRRAA